MKLLKNKGFAIFCILLTLILAFSAIFSVEIGGYKKFERKVEKLASENLIDKHLILAIIKTESNFNPLAVSKKGAVGLMQIMPSTAEFISSELLNDVEYDITSVEDNLLFGIVYFKYLLDKFLVEDYAIIAYNAGEGNVNTWLENGGNIPFLETRNYLKKVKRRKSLYKSVVGQ